MDSIVARSVTSSLRIKRVEDGVLKLLKVLLLLLRSLLAKVAIRGLLPTLLSLANFFT